MSGFVLKIIGAIAMVLNHMSYTNESLIIPLYYIGRMAFPIFAFLIAEGYIHTRHYNKYLTRVIVFAIISQVPYYYFTKLYKPNVSFFELNVLFNFALALISLKLFDIIKAKFKKKPAVGIVFGLIPGIILAAVAERFSIEYGMLAIVFAFIFYLLKNHKSITVWVYTIFITAYLCQGIVTTSTEIILDVYKIKNILFQLLGFEAALAAITLYNNQRGKDGKNVRLAFYFFYPIHFVLLMLVNNFLIK